MDAETRRICISYAGDDFDKPREVTIRTFDVYGSEQWTADDFLQKIKEAIEAIPDDKRAAAKVELEGDYEQTTRLVISYRGLEDEKAVQDRVAQCIAYANERIRSERATYEALKKKFEKPGT